MLAKYLLAGLAAAILLACLARRGRSPQARTWLLVGTIFALVSL